MRKYMNYQRLYKFYAIAISLLGLAILVMAISQLTLVRLPEVLVMNLFSLSAGFFMMPMPKSRTYFTFGAPVAILCILVLKEFAALPYVFAMFFANLYKRKTTRWAPIVLILWDTLRYAPILWISWFIYEKLGGTDFHSLSELRIFPFAAMVLAAAALDLISMNLATAIRLGKPPWAPVIPLTTQTDALFAPLAIPMYLFYQFQGARGLFFLIFPFLILLTFVKFFVVQAYKKQESMDALNVAGELIQARLSLKGLMERAFDRLAAIFDPRVVVELFTVSEGSGWKFEGHKGESPWANQAPSPAFLEEVRGVLSKDPALIRDISQDQRFAPYRDSGLVSLLIIPLLLEERNIGFVLCAHPVFRFFHEGHVELAKILVGQLSSALVSARLHEALAATNESLAATLKKLRETQAQLVQAEKIAGLSKLVAGVAHELNNPLNLFTLQVPLLKDDVDKLRELVDIYQMYEVHLPDEDQSLLADFKEKIQYVPGRITKSFIALHEGTSRSKHIVENLRTFAGTERLGDGWNYVDIQEAIDSALMILAPLHHGRIVLHQEINAIPKVRGNASQINEVLMNLLANAFEAIEGEGEVWITAVSSDGKLEVAIKDSGRGIPDAIQKRIFEPFYTTKEVGKGTGLGLSIVYSLVKQHKGEISVESREGSGTTFKITLPKNGERGVRPVEHEPVRPLL